MFKIMFAIYLIGPYTEIGLAQHQKRVTSQDVLARS